jgi:nucleoside-diphosphate-sugar epimerase
MNCLVTGASGFIGSALVKRLTQEGYHVRAVLHTSVPQHRLTEVDYVTADLTDPTSLSDLIHDGDVVFHCAALVKDFGSKKTFMNVNFKATQYLAEACNHKIQRFIFLSHLHHVSTQQRGWYSYSKALAEQYLLHKQQRENFPAVIIQPGNVYGPGATTWCLRPLQAIQQDHIALINHGKGLFLHTYIDNLLDGLLRALTASSIEGEVIQITDGENNTTWKTYFNDLAALAGKEPITRSLAKPTVSLISWYMMLRYFLFHKEPLITPTAVRMFTNTDAVSIENAKKLLGYTPSIRYSEAMTRIADWLKSEQYI